MKFKDFKNCSVCCVLYKYFRKFVRELGKFGILVNSGCEMSRWGNRGFIIL